MIGDIVLYGMNEMDIVRQIETVVQDIITT